MVSLRSVSLEIVVQQRICLLHSFSRQACASLLRPPGALGFIPSAMSTNKKASLSTCFKWD